MTGRMLAEGYQLFRIDYTTASGGDASKLADHVAQVERWIAREYAVKVVHWFLRTREGNGVAHTVTGLKALRGDHRRALYVQQDRLSRKWEEIHGAHRVWISRMGRTGTDRQQVARYIATQYISRQGKDGWDAQVSMGFTRSLWPFDRARSWREHVRTWCDRAGVMEYRTWGVVFVLSGLARGEMLREWVSLIAGHYEISGRIASYCAAVAL